MLPHLWLSWTGILVTLVAGNYVGQRRSFEPPPDAATQIINNYRQYPDRYIRIVDETWRSDPAGRTGFHSFTLRNLATVPYHDIEVRVKYQTSDGKDLAVRTAKVPGNLAGLGKRQCKITIANIPKGADSAQCSIVKAILY
jgi:hypothetical protein